MKNIEVKQYLKTKDKTKISVISHVIYSDYERIKISSKLSIPVKNWNFEEQCVKSGTEYAAEYNAMLKQQIKTIEDIYLKSVLAGVQFTKAYLEERFHEKKPEKGEKDFMELLPEWIESSRMTKTEGTIKSHQTTFNHLMEFAKKKRYAITFESINRDFYNQFTKFLFYDKDNFNSNAGRHIKNIKTFLNDMTEQGLNNNLEYDKKYFKAFKDEPEIFALTMDELKQMSVADLDEKLDKVRDLFLFEAYTGIRFSDVQNLKHENPNSDFVLVPVIKTKDFLKLPLNTKAKSILNKYFDVEANRVELPKISNQRMNSYLKEICQILEWDEKITVVKFKGVKRYEFQMEKQELVTTHTARRSFVTNALELGIPPTLVMQLVGHKKIDTMKRYAKHNEKTLQDAINKFNF
jgi:site-specific recombinase XerD